MVYGPWADGHRTASIAARCSVLCALRYVGFTIGASMMFDLNVKGSPTRRRHRLRLRPKQCQDGQVDDNGNTWRSAAKL